MEKEKKLKLTSRWITLVAEGARTSISRSYEGKEQNGKNGRSLYFCYFSIVLQHSLKWIDQNVPETGEKKCARNHIVNRSIPPGIVVSTLANFLLRFVHFVFPPKPRNFASTPGFESRPLFFIFFIMIESHFIFLFQVKTPFSLLSRFIILIRNEK